MRDNKLLDRCFFVYVLGSLSVSVLIFLNFGVTEDDSGRAQFFNSELNELAIKLTASLMIVIIYFFNDYLKLANKPFCTFNVCSTAFVSNIKVRFKNCIAIDYFNYFLLNIFMDH